MRRVSLDRLARRQLLFRPDRARLHVRRDRLLQRRVVFLGHPVYGRCSIGAVQHRSCPPASAAWSRSGSPSTTPARLSVWAVLAMFVTCAIAVLDASLAAGIRARTALPMRALVVARRASRPIGLLHGLRLPQPGCVSSRRRDSRPTPWFWAVNGSAGVLAAGIAVGVSITFSISASLWVGAACYLILGPISIALHNLGTVGAVRRSNGSKLALGARGSFRCY